MKIWIGLKPEEQDIASRLPNLPNPTVPVGLTEAESVELYKVGKPTEFDFEPKNHWDVGEDLGILDFERAAKVSGARFVYYLGAGQSWNGPFTTLCLMNMPRKALPKFCHHTL